MDVAKYIGLFLLKNNFVYIHGLGNLQLKKRPAAYEGNELVASSYEVVLTPSGSIDDNLANFIANNEQISISKASNALRDFSVQAREELQEGKDVVIPAIGRFVQQQGKIDFITDQAFQFTPPGIPTVKIAPQKPVEPFSSSYQQPQQRTAAAQEYGAPDPDPKSGSVNWLRVAAVALGFIVMAVVIYFLVQYMSDSNSTRDEPLLPTQMEMEAPATVESVEPAPTAPAVVADDNQSLSFKVLIGRPYPNLERAIWRVNQLRSFGHKVELDAAADSSSFAVVLPVSSIPAADTAHLLDSLRRFLGGATIYDQQ